jgi:hypothetical protein
MGRVRAWIASIAIHVALLLAALALPERQPPRDPFAELTAIEWIELEAAPQRPPGEEDEAAAAADRPSAGAPADEPDAASPAPRRRRPHSRAPTTEAPSLPPAATPPSHGAAPLALHGLRERAGPPAPRASARVIDPAAAGERYGPETPTDDRQHATARDAGFRPNRRGELVYRDPLAPWTATLLPDGRVRFDDHLGPTLRTDEEGGIALPGLKELVPHARGFDFWQAHKRRLLKSTRELRLRMAVEFAERNLDRQLAQLYRDLLEVWQDAGEPAPARRERIFALWDECVEALEVDLGDFTDHEPSRIDALREEAGTRARARVVEFVRRHLPEGDAEAYTPGELHRLNARRKSRERFDPYGIADRP